MPCAKNNAWCRFAGPPTESFGYKRGSAAKRSAGFARKISMVEINAYRSDVLDDYADVNFFNLARIFATSASIS